MSRQRLLAAAAVAAAHVLGALAETPDTFARVRSLAGAAGFESQQVLSELDAGHRRVEDFPLLAAVLAPDARYSADEVNTAFLWKTEPELEALLGGDDPLPPAGLLGFKPPAGGDDGAAGPLGAAASPPPRSLLEAGAAAEEDDLPKAFDNRKKVFTYNTDCRTPVGEQGCNDCAVFAAVDSVAWRSCILQRRWETEEGWTGKATTGAPRISKQTGNDCILKKCRGVGATADDVFSTWLKSDGWRSDSCLPYRVPTFGKCDGKCTATGAASKKKADYDTRFEIVSHETIRFPKSGGKLTKAEAIKATKRALKEGGPVYASFEFPYFPLMFHGKNKKSPKHINILDAPVVRGKPKDGSRPVGHAVMIVGWGKGASGAEYWIVRNQWGTGWGWNGDGFVATSADYVRYVSFATPKLRHRAEQKEFYEAYVARGDQALRSYAELVTRGAGLVERLAKTLAKVPAALRPHTGTVYQKLASTLSRLDAAVKTVAGADKRHADRCAAFFGFLERTDSETRLMNADSAGRAQWKTAAAGGTACEDSVEKAVALFENRFRQAVGALLWLHADTANQGAHYLGVLTRVFGADCQKQKAKNLCGDKYFKNTNKWMNHLWKMERKKEMASLKLLAEKTYGFELILVMMDASKGTRSGGDWLRHRRYASSTDKAMATCRWLAGACCARYPAAKGCQ